MLLQLRRLFKHRWTEDASRALSSDALARLQSHIASSEALHTGEIRICVEAGLPNSYLLRPDATSTLVRQRAMAQFGRLRVWDTEQNNGVLIYLCLAERAIELVADRGVNAVVGAAPWERVVAQLGSTLRQGQFEEGIHAAIHSVTALLAQHFPTQDNEPNPNELPDAPVLA